MNKHTLGTQMRHWLYKMYAPLQRTIAPGLRNSQYSYRATLESNIDSHTKWLDLGCGHQILPDWMPDQSAAQQMLIRSSGMAIGIDAFHLSLQKNTVLKHRLRGDIEQLPFAGSTFDLVTANVVVEHVENPSELLREVCRVLKPGGRFIFHTPNRSGYPTLFARVLPQRLKVSLVFLLQGREEDDVFRTFYRLNTETAVRRLASQAQLKTRTVDLVEHSAQTVMLGPVVIFELLWIVLLRLEFMRAWRPNIVAVLEKPFN